MPTETLTTPNVGDTLYWAPDGYRRRLDVRLVDGDQIVVTWFRIASEYTYAAWIGPAELAQCVTEVERDDRSMDERLAAEPTNARDPLAQHRRKDGWHRVAQDMVDDFGALADSEVRAAVAVLKRAQVTPQLYRLLFNA